MFQLPTTMNRRKPAARSGHCLLLGIVFGLVCSANAMARTSSTLTPQTLNAQDTPMIAIAPPPLVADKITEIDTYLNAYAQTGRLSGNVIITHGGEPALIRSYGMANREHAVANIPATKFRIGSITKQFTAAAILQLHEQGLVELQAPISTYLPDYPNGEQITIHHLLTHTSGIPEYLDGTTFPDIAEWMRLPSTLDQLLERFQDLPLDFDPGEQFQYSNSGYVVLTQIIETVSGQPYTDYVQTHIFDPLGMDHTGYEMPKAVVSNLAQGYLRIGQDLYLQTEPIDMSLPQGAGGLYSTLGDLGIWQRWLYGSADDRSLLSPVSRALLMTPWVKMGDPEDGTSAFYGYGLVTDTYLERQRIHHSGGINGFLSTLMHYPEEDLTISLLLNLDNQPPATIAEGLAAILFGEDYAMPQVQTAVAIDPTLYTRYVGTYQLLPELQIRLWVEDEQLMGQATGQDSFALYPSSETQFFAQVADITIAFSLEEDGTVDGLTLHQFGHELFAIKLDD